MLTSPLPKQYSDAVYTALPFQERVLLQAFANVGAEEIGTNWGPFVKMVLAAAGVFGPAPWCAAFLTFCLLRAGAPKSLIFFKVVLPASTYYWWRYAQRNGRARSSPKRGMFWVGNSAGGGHIGAIAEVLKTGEIRCYEGNTNAAGSREGKYVMQRVRSPMSLRATYDRFCFIDIRGLEKW